MLSRLLWSTAFALSAFLAFASEAFAATDRVKVGAGTFVVALAVIGVWFVAFLVKWYFGLAGVIPPPIEDDGHSSYPSLPADGHAAEHAPSHH